MSEKSLIEICRELQSCKKANDNPTLPEIFGVQYREVHITQWLGYLFNPTYNGLVPINALLETVGVEAIKSSEKYEIYTEYMFDSGRIIDILIGTDKYLIGIENKILSDEQYKQTYDYFNSLEIMKNNREIICIYLYPEINKVGKISGGFKKVTYTSFIKALECNRKNFLQSDKQCMILDEFIRYVKEILMTKFQSLTKCAKIYAKYSNDFYEAEKELVAFKNFVIKQLKNKAEEKKMKFKSDKDYCQINYVIKKKSFNFHFEIQIRDEILSESESIILFVHLEKYQSTKELFQEEIAFFNEEAKKRNLPTSENWRIESNTCTILSIQFPVNFKSEKEADTMLQDVINKIEELHEWKEIAEKCSKNQDKISL